MMWKAKLKEEHKQTNKKEAENKFLLCLTMTNTYEIYDLVFNVYVAPYFRI